MYFSREKKVLEAKDYKIRDLDEQVIYDIEFFFFFSLNREFSLNYYIFTCLQLRDLMVYLESGKTMEQLSISDEIKDVIVLPISMASSSTNSSKGGLKANNSRRNKNYNCKSSIPEWILYLACKFYFIFISRIYEWMYVKFLSIKY